ncbi:hypothetical protein IAU59_000494 [Kwoniella sp. CBS 9459]
MKLIRDFFGSTGEGVTERRGRGAADALGRRGGSGQGITTTRESNISYGLGPPTSTYTQWRGLGDEPKIAGSTGGFIGLISGIAVVVVVSVFAGIWFYNRHRKRLPPKSNAKSRSSIITHNPLPSLSFSRPSTDPYADAEAELHRHRQGDDDDLDQTPKASRHGFTRPVYTRQKSSDWDLRMDDSDADAEGNGPYELRNGDRPYSNNSYSSYNDQWKGKGKGKERAWTTEGAGVGMGVVMPSQPDEAAIPLRTKSPRPGLSSIPSHRAPRSMSSSSLTAAVSDTAIGNIYGNGNGNSTGKTGAKSGQQDDDERVKPAIVNPFENPYDDTRLSPIPAMRRHDSQSSFSSMESDIADEKRPNIAGLEIERDRGGSSGGDSTSKSTSTSDDGRSVRVSQIRQGSRFVERFESKESLA